MPRFPRLGGKRATLVVLGAAVFGLLWLFPRTKADANDAPPEPGEIDVRPNQTQGAISPLIYGMGLEWVENGNRILDPGTGRLRPEVLRLLSPLHIPVWRFPGGILADYYSWRDGVGPRESRPKRENPMDGSVHENNFGTDEFINLCRSLGSEALVTANYGTGSLADTLAWQQYFLNHKFPVRYWEVGNEIYLTESSKNANIRGNDARIFHNATDYAKAFHEWSHALRAADSDALVGAIAGTREHTSSQHRDWLDVLLSSAGHDVDFIALHNAFAPMIFGAYNYRDPEKRSDAYRAMWTQPLFSGEDTRTVRDRFRDAHADAPSRIAITEHFPLFGGGGPKDQILSILDQSRTLAAALYTAALLHTFMREKVWMANYNVATSKWFGALLTDTDSGLIRTPTYYLYDLYRNHFGGTLVEASVHSPVYSSGRVGGVPRRNIVPYLDAVASTDNAGGIYLAVINRHLDRPIEATVRVAGLAPGAAPADVYTLNGATPNSINGPPLTQTVAGGSPENVEIKHTSWTTDDLKYRFPAHSLTILQWQTQP